ncbi:MAG TPA: hypothetical protein VN928_02685 [Myxococcales bacterium]|nr:hypothetical protein [Myxococcales bacterium]
MFSLKLTARPDARMVEVPLEIEAELPREFEGAALLASSGLPRRVQIKAAKDALKLSTAYRADRLVGDIVRTALRGTSSDVLRVQDAVMKFVRAVRDRRQDGASLLVSSNGRGKIDVVEAMGTARPLPPPLPPQPFEKTRAPAPPDRTAMLERRVADLEAAMTRLATGGDLVERIAQLEQKLSPAMAQISRTLGTKEIAGPGLENRSVQTVARSAPAPRRVTAIDAYAEGLRSELRAKAAAAAERARAEVERCDRAAALAADAELLGAQPDGTSQRLRDASAQVAARQTSLERLAEEMEFYSGPDLPVASQLLARLEDASARDPGPSLEPAAQAIVRGAKGGDGESRTVWLQRAAALCGWQLITPAPGDAVQPGFHQPVDTGGDTVVALVSPGLKRADGSPIVEAQVKVDPGAARPERKSTARPPPPPPDAELPSGNLDAAAQAEPAIAEARPAGSAPPFALLPPHASEPELPSNGVSEETPVRPEEAAAAAMAAARVLRIVTGDPAMNDEALAAEMALAASGSDGIEGDLVDIRSEDIHVVMNGPPDHLKPTS